MGVNPTDICEIQSPAGLIKVEDAELPQARTNFGAANVLVVGNDTDDGTAVLPQVVSIEVVDEITIRVLFDKAMPTNTALGVLLASNFVMTGPGKGTFASSPTAVEHISAGTLFELTWPSDQKMVDEEDVTITVNSSNVRDAGGNLLDNSHKAGTAEAVAIAPTLETIEIIGGVSGTVHLFFDSLMDHDLALEPTNYTLTGTAKNDRGSHPSGAVFGADNTEVVLSWNSGTFVSGTVTITVADGVEDTAGNPINPAAKSGSDSL
jgi:hypothetical protein